MIRVITKLPNKGKVKTHKYVVLNFVIHKRLSKATMLQWPREKKIPTAVTLGMVIVNKGYNKITELRTIFHYGSKIRCFQTLIVECLRLILFSFLMHLCDMQVNCISMESVKCAQSNIIKTCRQSEIWYLFDKIRIKGQIVTFYCFCNALPFIIFRDL